METTIDAAEQKAKALKKRSDQLRSAAESIKTWAGILVAGWVVVGVAGGAGAASSLVHYGDSSAAIIFGAIVGGFVGQVIGMAIFSKCRLDSEVALRMDAHFTARER